MSMILSALTSRVGGGLAWVLCAGLLVWGGWNHVQVMRLDGKVATLQQQVQHAELEARGAKATLEQKEVMVGALQVQTQNCFDAFADFKADNGKVEMVIKRVKVTPDGMVDKAGSDEISALYNSFVE